MQSDVAPLGLENQLHLSTINISPSGAGIHSLPKKSGRVSSFQFAFHRELKTDYLRRPPPPPPPLPPPPPPPPLEDPMLEAPRELLARELLPL